MKKRLEALKKDQKGFTLVELIVVLVILAILAALLVPALLGYIDRARNSKYLEEARSVYTAVQAVNDERYAKAGGAVVDLSNKDDCTKVNSLITPTSLLKSDGSAALNSAGAVTYGTADRHAQFTVSTFVNLIFISQDGTYVKISMDSKGNWDTDNMKTSSDGTTWN